MCVCMSVILVKVNNIRCRVINFLFVVTATDTGRERDELLWQIIIIKVVVLSICTISLSDMKDKGESLSGIRFPNPSILASKKRFYQLMWF